MFRKCLINISYLQDAVEGRYSSAPMIEMTLPSSLDPTLAPPGRKLTLLII
jgi:phytoene dehydrogenase-like protein